MLIYYNNYYYTKNYASIIRQGLIWHTESTFHVSYQVLNCQFMVAGQWRSQGVAKYVQEHNMKPTKGVQKERLTIKDM